MKKHTFIVIGTVFALLVAGTTFAGEGITVGKGDLKVGGILQAGYTYNMEDDGNVDAFKLNRARFLFWGTIVPDKVKYFVQLETKGGTGLLDYKARFFYINNTEITFGRFLPNFTIYMPYSTAKLEMINYPLVTQEFAMWRQVGVQSTTKTEFVDFNIGIFNGADQKNNTTDNNDAKDFLLRAEFKPPMETMNIRAGGYAWLGFAFPSYTEAGVTTQYPEETIKKNRFGFFVKADHKDMPLKIRGEFLMAADEYMTEATMDNLETTDATAFFVHGSYGITSEIDLLLRYDSHDPNSDVDDDGESWLTLGGNYYLDGLNSMFYLNYIHKSEQGTSVDNDLVVAQVQILF